MKRSWDLKPNLLDCILEERIVPAFNNFGIVILTTSGLALVTPFPGASNNASGSGGSSNTAASVSGAAQPTSLYLTGNRGVSSLAPGNFTGNPSVGGSAVAGSSGGVSFSIKVGSGADEAGGPVSATPAASRTNPADNGNRAPIMAYIGSAGASAVSTAPAAGQTTQAAPVPQLPPQGVVIPGSPTGPGAVGSTPTNPMNPQFGAPRLVRGLGASLMPSLPGGLGVSNSLSPPGMAGP